MQWAPTFAECHICGASMRTDGRKDPYLNCPVCGADFENRNEETLRRKFNCTYKNGARGIKGTLFLSDKRLIFVGDNDYNKPPTLMFGGLIGAFFAFKAAKAFKDGPPPAEAIIVLSGVTAFDATESGLTVRIREGGGETYEFVSREFKQLTIDNARLGGG